MKKPSILITGANGFIGTALRRKLENYYEIIQFSYSDFLYFSAHEHARNSLIHDLSLKDISHVVHLGAKVHAKFSLNHENSLREYIRSNVYYTEFIAQLILPFENTHFIFLSTAGVYGSGSFNQNNIYTEFSKIKPNNQYSLSKYMAENCLQSIFQSCSERLLILRVASVIGVGCPGSVGLLSLISKLKLLPEFSIDGNISIRSFAHVEYLVDIIVYFINNKDAFGNILNVSNLDLKLAEIFDYVKIERPTHKLSIYMPTLLANIAIRLPFLKRYFKPLLLNHILCDGALKRILKAKS